MTITLTTHPDNTVRVQKSVAPALASITGPTGGPVSPPETSTSALGIPVAQNSLGNIGIINGVDIDALGEAGLHYCAEVYGCDFRIVREFGRLGRDEAARAEFEYEWNEKPELGHIEDFLVQTENNSARLSTTAQAEEDAETALEEAEYAAQLAAEEAEEAQNAAGSGRTFDSAGRKAMFRHLRKWRKNSEAIEAWQRAELHLADEEFGPDWWKV